VVTSVVWLLFVGITAWQTWPADDLPDAPWIATPSKPKIIDPFDEFPDAKPREFTDAEVGLAKPYDVAAERGEALVKGAFVGITPPVVMLLLGMSLIWVVPGLRNLKRS